MSSGNGPQPPVGSWVFASIGDCPARVRYQRWRDDVWFDENGSAEFWDELIDRIDTLPPET